MSILVEKGAHSCSDIHFPKTVKYPIPPQDSVLILKTQGKKHIPLWFLGVLKVEPREPGILQPRPSQVRILAIKFPFV